MTENIPEQIKIRSSVNLRLSRFSTKDVQPVPVCRTMLVNLRLRPLEERIEKLGIGVKLGKFRRKHFHRLNRISG